MAQISPRAGTSLISCSPGQGSKLTAGGYCQLHLSQCWSAGYQGNQAWPTQDGSLNTSPAGRRTLRPYQTIKRIGVLDPAEPGGSFLGRQALESEGRPQQRPGPVRAIGPCRRASSRLCLAAARLNHQPPWLLQLASATPQNSADPCIYSQRQQSLDFSGGRRQRWGGRPLGAAVLDCCLGVTPPCLLAELLFCPPGSWGPHLHSAF